MTRSCAEEESPPPVRGPLAARDGLGLHGNLQLRLPPTMLAGACRHARGAGLEVSELPEPCCRE